MYQLAPLLLFFFEFEMSLLGPFIFTNVKFKIRPVITSMTITVFAVGATRSVSHPPPEERVDKENSPLGQERE